MNIKKPFYLIVILSFFICCGLKPEEVERIIEDGVEVVINHLEPYKINGELNIITLEKEFSIDTEKDEIARIGLFYFSWFDIDSKGNIYLLNEKSDENCIFRFDKEGHFVTAFARSGQGPGEIHPSVYTMHINNQDEIIIHNSIARKTSVLNASGKFVKEINSGEKRYFSLSHMRSGNYLIPYGIAYMPPTSKISMCMSLGIFDAEFNDVKELERYELPRVSPNEKRNAIPDRIVACVGNGSIYVGKRKLGYEIWVYDLEGNLVRKIRKEYTPVKVSKDYKNYFYEQRKNVLSKERLDRYYFPEHFPAFQHMVADEKGRLFVLTYEESKPSRDKIYDIFNAEGVFIGRVDVAGSYPPAIRKIKNSHLYCYRIKDSGYRELVVYRMNWE